MPCATSQGYVSYLCAEVGRQKLHMNTGTLWRRRRRRSIDRQRGDTSHDRSRPSTSRGPEGGPSVFLNRSQLCRCHCSCASCGCDCVFVVCTDDAPEMEPSARGPTPRSMLPFFDTMSTNWCTTCSTDNVCVALLTGTGTSPSTHLVFPLRGGYSRRRIQLLCRPPCG